MTIVAWDETLIAVDSRGTSQGTCYNIEKYSRGSVHSQKFITFHTGCFSSGLLLQSWFHDSRVNNKFPKEEVNKENQFARLIVATKEGVYWYEGTPDKMTTIDRYMAWGSGMDYGMGAFYMGANAIQAVEAACKHDESCGGPIIAFNYRTMERVEV